MAASLPRVRAAVGGFLGYTNVHTTDARYDTGGIGAYGRGGVQISEVFGLDAEGGFASLLLTLAGRAALFASITPIDRLSISAGGMFTAFHNSGFHNSSRNGRIASVPVRVCVYPISPRQEGGNRRGLELMAQADAGVAFGEYLDPVFAIGFYTGVGYAWF